MFLRRTLLEDRTVVGSRIIFGHGVGNGDILQMAVPFCTVRRRVINLQQTSLPVGAAAHLRIRNRLVGTGQHAA
jgi:hypothetical protein